MTKNELTAAIAERTGFTKRGALNVIDTFVDVVTETLANGDNVVLMGFGTFDTKKVAGRVGRNPQDGSPITIDAKTAPTFKAGVTLKAKVRGG